MTHQPLRVRAYPSGQIITYGDGLPLDGPLAWAFFDALPDAERDALPPLNGPDAIDFDLPLAKWVGGGAWGWRCSWACADIRAEGRAEIRKRTISDEAAAWSDARRMDTSAGRFKPADLAYPSIVAPVITWYCVGDLGQIRALLSRIHAVGKATNKGYGRIMRWEVEPHAADLSLACDGELMRALPPEVARPLVAQPELYFERKHGIRPPYHHASRRATVWVPFPGVLSRAA